jgi:hypothetical protein
MNARDFSVDTCVKRYEPLADADDYEQKQADYRKAQCAVDCSEAIYATDENRVFAELISIGNDARITQRDGDIDEKISFVDRVVAHIIKLIDDYATEQSELDLERHYEHR